jgi:hypothetical protein
MKDLYDILAVLLAADEHPHMKDEPAYQEAKAKLDASDEVQTAYEEARMFFEKHPVLVGIGPMPVDVRKRIGKTLEKHASVVSPRVKMNLSPWTIRTQFAWAAALVLLLAGMAVVSSRVANRQVRQKQMMAYQAQPPADAFRSFAGSLVSATLPLQEMDTDTTQLVSWLESRGSPPLQIPNALAGKEGIGCAYLDGPDGKISLVCLKVENQILHLFITDAASLELSGSTPPRQLLIHDRKALQWNDAQNAFLLMTHEPGEELPEMFL